jgi:hypothetical protein
MGRGDEWVGIEGKCKCFLYVVGRDVNIMTAVKLLSIISEGAVLKNNKRGNVIVVGKD